MSTINRTRIALRNIGEHFQFSQEHLNLEDEYCARRRWKKLLQIISNAGENDLYEKLSKCSKNHPCDIVGCPKCDCSRRSATAHVLKQKIDDMRANGGRPYAVSIIPKESMMSGKQLQKYSPVEVRRLMDRFRKAIGRHLENYRTYSFLSLDISCHKMQPEPSTKTSYRYCLHLHGVLVVWGMPKSRRKRKAFREKIEQALVQALNPYKDACEDRNVVLLKYIPKDKEESPKGHNLASWITYTLKSIFNINGVYSKKSVGLLGKYDVPIRIFLSGLTYRRRYLEVRTQGGEKDR